MKKILTIILSFLLLLSIFNFNIYAIDNESIGFTYDPYSNLGKYINKNGMIDDLAFYYYQSSGYNPETPEIKPQSEIVVYLKKGAPNQTIELIESISNDFDKVTFKYCTYSYNDLKNLAYEILKIDNSNRIKGLSVSANEFEAILVIDIEKDYYDSLSKTIKNTYSSYDNYLEIRSYDPNMDRTGVLEVGYGNTSSTNSNTILKYVFFSFVLLIVVFCVFLITRKIFAKKLITNNGNTVTSYSNSNVKEIVKEGYEPSEKVYNNIKEELKK